MDENWKRGIPPLGEPEVDMTGDEVLEPYSAMEERLDKALGFYLTLFDDFPALIWRCDVNAKCDYFNKTWLAFTGRPLADELDDGWAAGVHPDDLNGCISGFLTAFARREPFRMEYRLRRHDGQYRWIADYGRPFEDIDGKFNGYIGTVYDVTEYRESMEALAKSEMRFRTLVEKAGDLIYTLSRDGRITYVSPNAQDLTGYTAEEIAGRNVLKGLLQEDMDAFLAYFNDVFAGKPVQPGVEYRFRKQDGTYVWHSASVTAVRDDSGEVSYYLCIGRDITEKKMLQAEKMRAAHLASVGELAAGLAHEINNPIGAVINYAQLLMDMDPPPGMAPILQRIMGEGERVAGIVRKLLSFVRCDDQEFMPVDAAAVLTDALDLMRTQLVNDGIAWETDVQGSLPPILAKDKPLQQVFINLINNARYALNTRYSDPCPGKFLGISVRTRQTPTGDVVAYIFRDLGTGIPSRVMDRLGDPFFTTKPPGEGTGLGLSISFGIVREHGGRITFVSSEGEYTEATVEIPVYQGGA